MQKNTYGVDVANYQPENLDSYVANGAKFAIVKLTQGTYYRNEKARAQIASAKAHGIEVAGYFYANHGSNLSQAIVEAQYAVATAKALGLPQGSILADDWEQGGGNSIWGNRTANADAILAAMDVIKEAGYVPMFYSGASAMKNNVSTSSIIIKYPNSLWVASYPVMGRIDVANMGYFPSMEGVAIWQFTDNWKGLNVDGNIAVIDTHTINYSKEEDDEMSWHPEVDYNELGRFKVTRPNGATLYKSADLNEAVGTRKAGQSFKIFKALKGAVQAGTNQWFAQSDGLTKINPLAVNSQAHGVVAKIIVDDAYTQAEPKPSAGIEHLNKGTSWKVFGRIGKYLIVNGAKGGKYVDGTKCKIILY